MNIKRKNEIKITREEYREKALEVVTKESTDTSGVSEEKKGNLAIAKVMMGIMFVEEIEEALFGKEEE